MSVLHIALHVGAHKTATSHLQRSLQKNRSLLAGHGVAFIPTHHYRELLAPLHKELMSSGAAEALRQQADPLIKGAARGAGRMIISDENIMGQLPRIAKDDTLYPWGRWRVANAAALLENHDLSLFLSIRNPATYLPSAYSESLLHMPYRSFRGFLSPFTPDALRWSSVVEGLRWRLPDIPLTVWRFEDYPQHRAQIAASLMGEPLPQEFEFLERHPRPGLSARALEQLSTWAAAGRDASDSDLIAHAADLFPKGTDWPAPVPFAPDEVAAMTRDYDADCAHIASLDGVRFLGA